MNGLHKSISRSTPLYDPRLVLLFVVLLAYIVWPILQVLVESVWRRGVGLDLTPWREFHERGHWIYGLRSLGVSAATVVLAGIFGTALAFLYYRVDFPGRGLLLGLSFLPFTLPPLVGVFAIWTLTGEGGIVSRVTEAILGHPLYLEKGYAGVLLIHTYSMYVFFLVLVGGTLAQMDESLIEASRDLGATRGQTFFRIVLPQLAPPLAGASLLTFMTSMASFTAPYYYMSGKPVLTIGIQQALEESRNGLASTDCVVLALCASVFIFLLMKFEGTIKGGTRGVARRRVKIDSPLLRGLTTVGAILLTFILLTPHLSMLAESFVKPGTGFIGVPVEHTLSNYAAIWHKTENWRPFANSLRAAGLATVAVVLFATMSAWASERMAFAGKAIMRLMVMIPWALPGTVIATGLLWISRKPNPLTLGLELRATIAILALAYFIRLIPLAHRTISGGLAQVPADLEGAARDLGATPWQSFRRVTFPLVFASLLAAATLAFATAMGEFVSSILLYAPGTEPIAVKIDQLRRGAGGIHLASAYSTILLILITLTFVIFSNRAQKAQT